MFDVIVVGGGHAGVEACFTAARMGVKTLLITQNINSIGKLYCNPSIGGLGKGHLVKELFVFGGLMLITALYTSLQCKVLNKSRGFSSQSTRIQVDKKKYQIFIKLALFSQKNLIIKEDTVLNILCNNNYVCGVTVKNGGHYRCSSVVVSTGTFLNSKFYPYVKKDTIIENELGKSLVSLGLKKDRFKTGTPPRLLAKTINFSTLIYQFSDYFAGNTHNYLIEPTQYNNSNYSYITYTNKKTCNIILRNIKNTVISKSLEYAVGPRYCPSIEDKFLRFPDKSEHQIFLEPETHNTKYVYPNGLSTSLPVHIQRSFVRSIHGLEDAVISIPGYAVEYDYFDPCCLHLTLETKMTRNLFLAGQINGTTGYEEAAVQGLVSGINAASFLLGKKKWYPERLVSYIGVLIDDLVNKGVFEPYRMFTSRVENRLFLYEDNLELSLYNYSFYYNLINIAIFKKVVYTQKKINSALKFFSFLYVAPATFLAIKINKFLNINLKDKYPLDNLLRRVLHVCTFFVNFFKVRRKSVFFLKHCEIKLKYFEYSLRQNSTVLDLQKKKRLRLSSIDDYRNISGLSSELCEKLNNIKPYNLEQASKVSGVTPSALVLILLFLK